MSLPIINSFVFNKVSAILSVFKSAVNLYCGQKSTCEVVIEVGKSWMWTTLMFDILIAIQMQHTLLDGSVAPPFVQMQLTLLGGVVIPPLASETQ